jgi:hypothetical protein
MLGFAAAWQAAHLAADSRPVPAPLLVAGQRLVTGLGAEALPSWLVKKLPMG